MGSNPVERTISTYSAMSHSQRLARPTSVRQDAAMWDEIVEILITLAILGPSAFVAIKLIYRKEVSRETMTGVFVWTAIMLFMQWSGYRIMAGDHNVVCEQLESVLAPKHPDEQYSDFMPHECDKYTADYGEGEIESN